MDPENDFATQEKCNDMHRKLQNAIREEVDLLGARISQSELDHLVHVRVWGDDKYEIANFTDDELFAAVTQLAQMQGTRRIASDTWDEELRAELAAARRKHLDIKIPMGHMGVKDDKMTLADLLWPTLINKCEDECLSGEVKTPVLKIIVEAAELCARLTGTSGLGGSDD
jgi:hypothetical protein